MYSTQKETGADMVLLLADGKTPDDVSDDEIRELLACKDLKEVDLNEAD